MEIPKFNLKTSSLLALSLMGALSLFMLLKNSQSSYKPGTKVIIIGATSGIGAALTDEFARRGFIIGITGRRENLLTEKEKLWPQQVSMQVMDVAQPEQAQVILQKLITQMGGVDIIVINAGIANLDRCWTKQEEVIDINVRGFAALASDSINYFLKQGHGHLVGISSIAALRGLSACPVYSASKAFISNYLEGARGYVQKINSKIYVTDIQPGFVDTAMGQVSTFWRATADKAAEQIADAIEQQRKQAYITHRWRIIAWLFKILPDCILYKFI